MHDAQVEVPLRLAATILASDLLEVAGERFVQAGAVRERGQDFRKLNGKPESIWSVEYVAIQVRMPQLWDCRGPELPASATNFPQSGSTPDGRSDRMRYHASARLVSNVRFGQSNRGVAAESEDSGARGGDREMKGKDYRKELFRLQLELVKLQGWVKAEGRKFVVIFEGRDAAGKGGVIKAILQYLSPRIVRTAALPAPTERETTQWYFQRYAAHLPAAGEIVLFDRSWYNRAGVERVMGFCTDDEYREFLRSCPEFERMLVRSGIPVIKYWFSVSDTEQEARFRSRLNEPHKRWKLSAMDLESWNRWVEYSRAKDEMFAHTDIEQAPWYVVDADIKRKARLNCIRHLLGLIPYRDLTPNPIELPPRKEPEDHERPPMSHQTFVKDWYSRPEG